MKILGIEIAAQNEREEFLAKKVNEELEKYMEEDRGMSATRISEDLNQIMAYGDCMHYLGMMDLVQQSAFYDELGNLKEELHKSKQKSDKLHPVLRQAMEKAVREGDGKYYVGRGDIPSATLDIIKDQCYIRNLGKWVDFLHPDYDMIVDPGVHEKVELESTRGKDKGKAPEKGGMKFGAYR